jgi:hypothetical protein
MDIVVDALQDIILAGSIEDARARARRALAALLRCNHVWSPIAHAGVARCLLCGEELLP